MDNDVTLCDFGHWPPRRGLHVGDNVRITSGPLAELTGQILKLNDQRCVLRLDELQNGVLLVISATSLELAVTPSAMAQ